MVTSLGLAYGKIVVDLGRVLRRQKDLRRSHVSGVLRLDFGMNGLLEIACQT